MPIFDQGYQHWNGTLRGQSTRVAVISARGIRVQLGNRWVRWILLASLGPAFLLSIFLVIWGLFETKSTLLTPFLMFFQNLPEELKAGPKGYRGAFWTLAVRQFFEAQLFFTMILVLLVGPDLISQDLRFNALPLYLSRPVRRYEYFLGKLGVIAFFLGATTILPVVLAFLLGFGFSLDPTVIRDTGWLFLGSLAFGLVVVVSSGLLMLAFSSLSRNSRYVGATWIVFWLVGNITSTILGDSVREDWCHLTSYTQNLLRMRDSLIGADAAWDQVQRLFQAGREGLDSITRSPFSRRRARSADPPPVPRRRERLNAFQSYFAPTTYPWWWSATVLGSLAAASVLVLATRVRSLDRLE